MDYSQILSQQFNIKRGVCPKTSSHCLMTATLFLLLHDTERKCTVQWMTQLIREFAEKLEYLRGLDKRRDEIRSLIDAQEKLTDETTLHLTRRHAKRT